MNEDIILGKKITNEKVANSIKDIDETVRTQKLSVATIEISDILFEKKSQKFLNQVFSPNEYKD